MTDRPIENCYWVVPGQLLAGEYPRDLDEDSSRAKLARLTEAGVSVFIDLTEAPDLYSYAQWIENGTHLRFPIEDTKVPCSPEQTTAILDAIDEHISEGRTVYIHCMGGVGRTGTIVGCWLARHGLGGHAALDRLHELWRACPKSRYRRSPESREQERYIREWRDGR